MIRKITHTDASTAEDTLEIAERVSSNAIHSTGSRGNRIQTTKLPAIIVALYLTLSAIILFNT